MRLIYGILAIAVALGSCEAQTERDRAGSSRPWSGRASDARERPAVADECAPPSAADRTSIEGACESHCARIRMVPGHEGLTDCLPTCIDQWLRHGCTAEYLAYLRCSAALPRHLAPSLGPPCEVSDNAFRRCVERRRACPNAARRQGQAASGQAW